MLALACRPQNHIGKWWTGETWVGDFDRGRFHCAHTCRAAEILPHVTKLNLGPAADRCPSAFLRRSSVQFHLDRAQDQASHSFALSFRHYIMASSTTAPQQHKQPSRKGKRAWRKNVDVSEVQHGIDNLREEIIKG